MTNDRIMTDYIEIGTTPTDEPCVQADKTVPYIADMRHEAARYIKQLKERFENFDNVSITIHIAEKCNIAYLEVRLVYNTDDMEGREQALFMADNLPMKWTSNEHFRWDIVEAVQYELAVAGMEGY